MKKLIILIVVLAAAALLYIVPGAGLFGKKKPNLILISIDTLRADRVGTYGYKRDTSPFIDKLAAKSVVFENATSPTSWTLPAHVSMLSSLYPTAHGVTLPKGFKIGKDTELLAEKLQKNGYNNFAYVAGGYLGKRYGFDRGFPEYITDKGKKRDGQFDVINSVAYARKKIEETPGDRPYFLFLHTFDVHCPYIVPEPHLSMFNSEKAEYIDPAHCASPYYNSMTLTDGQALYLSDRYDGSINWVDKNLGGLFTFLEERRQLDNTVIVITSDHGDEFYEHGRIGHKNSLHKQLIMVPLIIYAPGMKPGRVNYPVSIVDIVPTVLELLGVEPVAAAQGSSLIPFMNGEPRAEEGFPAFQFSELDMGTKLRSHFNLAGHYIRNMKKNEESKYYDLTTDPEERNNIIGAAAGEVQERHAELEAVMAGMKRSKTEILEKASKEEIEKLRSLGYLK